MTEQEWMEKLKQEGYKDLIVFRWEPGWVAGEHTHYHHTVHVVLSGELSITDKSGSQTYSPGERVEFPKGTVHVAKGGNTAGSMIVGKKT